MIKIRGLAIALLVLVLLGLTAVGVTYIAASKIYRGKVSALHSELATQQKSLKAHQEASTSKKEGITCGECHKDVSFHTPEKLRAKKEDARVCTNCHEDIHVIHKAQPCELCHMGKQKTATFTFPTPEKGKLLVCENCHGSNYLEIHKNVPNNCQACHKGDVLKYHSEKEYMQLKISKFLNKAVG